jgi:hypothetical protein
MIFAFCQAGVVQDLAHLARELHQIAAVQPDAPQWRPQRSSGVRAVQGVIGIDEVGGRVAQQILQPPERFFLGWEGLNPGVRGGSEDRNAVAEAGFGVAGSDAAADVGCASGQYAGFGRVRAARAEIHHRAALGDLDDARRLGRDQRLKADGREQVCFGDLRFHQGRANSQERLVGEDGRAFRHGEEIAGEAEPAQSVEEFGGRAPELGEAAEIVDLLVGEFRLSR